MNVDKRKLKKLGYGALAIFGSAGVYYSSEIVRSSIFNLGRETTITQYATPICCFATIPFFTAIFGLTMLGWECFSYCRIKSKGIEEVEVEKIKEEFSRRDESLKRIKEFEKGASRYYELLKK